MLFWQQISRLTINIEMRRTDRARRVLVSYLSYVAFLIWLLLPRVALGDWTYKTKITLLPDSTLNVASKAKKTYAAWRASGGLSSMKSLTKAFATQKAGFSIDGKTTIFCDSRCTYTSEPIPNLSNPSHPSHTTQLFDGVNTFTNNGQFGNILPGDRVYGLASPAGKILLGRFEPSGKVITPRSVTSGAYEVKQFDEPSTVRTQTNYLANGWISSIALYFPNAGPTHPFAKYEVTSYDEKGNAKSMVVTFLSHARAYRKEEYALIGYSESATKTPSDVFPLGETVVDERLGSAQQDQVSYDWNGKLPTIMELRLKNKPLTFFTANRAAARNSLIFAGILLAAITWAFARKRIRQPRHSVS